MERRKWVGRRYEDHIRNDIMIKLTEEENAWRMALGDPRYHQLIERRREIRRTADSLHLDMNGERVFRFGCSFMMSNRI